MWTPQAEGLCLGEPLRLLYFQRPPTLPLAGVPVFLLQMGSKVVLSMRVSGTLANPFPGPWQTPGPGSSAWTGSGGPSASPSSSPAAVTHLYLPSQAWAALCRGKSGRLSGGWREPGPPPLPPFPIRGARGTGGRETLGPYVKQTQARTGSCHLPSYFVLKRVSAPESQPPGAAGSSGPSLQASSPSLMDVAAGRALSWSRVSAPQPLVRTGPWGREVPPHGWWSSGARPPCLSPLHASEPGASWVPS